MSSALPWGPLAGLSALPGDNSVHIDACSATSVPEGGTVARCTCEWAGSSSQVNYSSRSCSGWCSSKKSSLSAWRHSSNKRVRAGEGGEGVPPPPTAPPFTPHPGLPLSSPPPDPGPPPVQRSSPNLTPHSLIQKSDFSFLSASLLFLPRQLIVPTNVVS